MASVMSSRMATPALRQIGQAASRRTIIQLATRQTARALPTYQRRSASTGSGPSSSSSSKTAIYAVGGLAGIGAAVWFFGLTDTKKAELEDDATGGHARARGMLGGVVDYQKVYNEIANVLEAEHYDDGSYGPVLIRLAWHCSGTYDKNSGNGGSNGATMRFAPESNHGANAGLLAARELLEPIHAKFPEMSYSDLWTLAGVVAVMQLGGPTIPWRPGRVDADASQCTPDGRLPDGDKDQDHLRQIFYRMGFDDEGIVALSGAHAVGRCHPDRSGFSGPWQHSPTSFNNEYYKLLFNEKWQLKKWDGPIQYEDKSTKSLMMLTTDMALTKDKAFKPIAKRFADDEGLFFTSFSKYFAQLLELGVPAKNFEGREPITFTPADV
ncbi:uncharacterized protein L969DRAFT_103348 [Mixia osmundae IAM 14324]|uniref:Peroxidase n=1 Tax=Mixia osmundae (strain CBS 9802 / IAM 14324 / JCM 22182 / KY 12970) TaxID=764103 RepID=G7E3N4_MIXOS|nr:uncharacterized protein L969DRAFT_103348 [Mixia osmundae IAM 14324]KEI39427.1 hypothetical protein L969DRAFT_103348 [Mixia osmundae IAM 14324]GAA97444.1 hypothetical protein E5Q_04123 [Mixia osmundae IAM 14324]